MISFNAQWAPNGVPTNAASAIQWEGAWQDRWKLAPSVQGADKKRAEIAALLSVQLVEDKVANEATLAALALSTLASAAPGDQFFNGDGRNGDRLRRPRHTNCWIWRSPSRSDLI